MDPDGELVVRLRAGDEEAFGTLLTRYHSRLVRLADSVVGRREQSEDAVQETWLAVVRGIEQFEGRSDLRTWLFQICVNRARSIARREGRSVPIDVTDDERAERFSPGGSWLDPPVSWGDPEDEVLAEALVRRVKQGIDTLPVTQRQVMTLRDIEGLSAAEVGEVLGLTEGNVRVLLHRGRGKVRAILEHEGVRP